MTKEELYRQWRCERHGYYYFPQHKPRPGLRVYYIVLAADLQTIYANIGMLCDLQVAEACDPSAGIYWKPAAYPSDDDMREAMKPWWKRLWEKLFSKDACLRRY